MLTHGRELLLFFFVAGSKGFEVFGLEDLAAIETLDIVHAIAAGEYLGTGVLAGSLHKPMR